MALDARKRRKNELLNAQNIGRALEFLKFDRRLQEKDELNLCCFRPDADERGDKGHFFPFLS